MSQPRSQPTSQAVLDPRLQSTSASPAVPATFTADDRPSRTYGVARLPPQALAQASTAPRVDHFKSGDGLSTNPYGGSDQQLAQPYFGFSSPQSLGTPQQRSSISTSNSGANASPAAATIPVAQANDTKTANDEREGEEAGEVHNEDDPRRPRACEACRGLKVRCDQDPAHPELPCRRCAKAGRQCIVTQPSRKRQKKADSRVAELERKLDALTAALHQQQPGPALFAPAPPLQMSVGPVNDQVSPISAVSSLKRQRTDDQDIRPATPASTNHNQNDASMANSTMNVARSAMPDAGHEIPPALAQEHSQLVQRMSLRLIDRIRSLIRPETADLIFGRFVNDMSPHLPAVVFTPGTTAEQVLNEKPFLFVCILSTAWVGIIHADIGHALGQEAIRAIADCIVQNGFKSLELIQAIQVLTLWYKPPENSNLTNFYQLVHMAAVMALDIGLGRRFNAAKARRGFGGPNANYAPGPQNVVPQDSDTLEARRAWLTCYYMCASASMVFRRPNLIRWTNYMKECIEILETHPDAFVSDKLFCQFVKIQHICEEIGLQFLMDDNTASVSITDPKVTYALNILESQLKSWADNIPLECRNATSLLFFEQVTNLYLHEIALHFNHNVEDFRLPFTEESLKATTNVSDTLTQNQLAALEACLKAAHGVLDAMLSFDLSTLRSLPILVYFVRCVYAFVILVKMDLAVDTPKSELGKIMKSDDIRIEYYLNRIISLFNEINGGTSGYQPHSKAVRILTVLRNWYINYKKSTTSAQQQRIEQQSQLAYDQTPLHLLSQVATVKRDDDGKINQHDWTFSSPHLAGWHRPTPTISHQQQQQQQQADQQRPRDSTLISTAPQNFSSNDANNNTLPPEVCTLDPGWGTGFEQAMDMALGSMDGLVGNGLDEWFLGDNMAPFAYPYGDLSSAAGGGGQTGGGANSGNAGSW